MDSLIAALACFLKAHSSILFGGFAGGLVRAIVSKAGTKWEKLLAGFMGSIIAYYLTPVLIPLFAAFFVIPASSASFTIGLIGMSLVEAVINIGKDYQRHPGKLKRDLRSILLRVLAAKDDRE